MSFPSYTPSYDELCTMIGNFNDAIDRALRLKDERTFRWAVVGRNKSVTMAARMVSLEDLETEPR